MIVSLIVTVLFGYLLGSVSFSYIIAKKIKKIDIRSEGSGNAGATNTLRVLGIGPAICVLLLDVAKGVAPALLAIALTNGDYPLVPALAGLAAILGHNWPIYFGFRGGKGVATSIGVVATLLFLPALCAGIVAILSIVFTKYVSLGSLLFAVLTPIAALIMLPFFHYPLEYIYLAVLLAILSLWRHRTNMGRLIAGTENKLGKKHA
ncbi:glycerol-3-phosphate 1-O-acyltransferase PlsY [Shouchella clausii]|jgi:acyl phosphate:glycerol-3-phosphate acyltransferase|uniref:Glycerol-3-phosphate acyltransferase n=1 Tax=Shouchella clausii TaxID=79880 RepID=A0A268RZ87_SHOCL|nr:glycerol-3-phosphate 1-O-acyltransferase PlsY [Shouchella clausii]PAD42913.1 acyl-phosphate glycerol 3-phosphate acyltransferase [Bacillus sp. 7520-S]SPU21735.1 membrane protein [Niallia circulans]AST97900.1 acyl-phosphate glycerol 3-phosphate acyltransferase [Shouchella clausii]MBU8597736.1 glycerol-3-phosphate 1-O-acyltransferase PlsY [Shouchella clausii]MCM3549073.1 glycerol-3-phosphate 1-O-acyltransferase PlsY [Shouchella clausii]